MTEIVTAFRHTTVNWKILERIKCTYLKYNYLVVYIFFGCLTGTLSSYKASSIPKHFNNRFPVQSSRITTISGFT